MTTALATLTNKFAERFGLGESQQELIATLKATAFKGQVSDAQMTALMLVAQQYNLNPWTKEIYAYPDKNGIVPVVGVDGWSRIINENSQLDGVEFVYSKETGTFEGKLIHDWIECIITRKDRTKPTIVREYFDEVKRDLNYANPWKTHPKRMHRHKALIQCARVAFGLVGIYDQDEAERIIEGEVIQEIKAENKQERPVLPELRIEELMTKYTQDKIDSEGVVTNFCPKSLIERGENTAQDFIDFLRKKYIMTEEIINTIKSWEPKGE